MPFSLILHNSKINYRKFILLAVTFSILCSPGFFLPPDAFAAVPAQIGSVTFAPNKTQMVLSWPAPSANPSITDYTIKFRIEGASDWTTFSDGVSTTASATVTGLTSGETYEFKVAAVNSDGTGAYTPALQSRTSDFEAGREFSEKQSFQAGKQFAAGTEFADEEDFSGGQMVFNGAQDFGDGTKFASGQDLSTATHTFGSNVKFQGNTNFADGQLFPAGTFFDDAQEFTGDKVYQFVSDGIIFGDGSGVVFQGAHTFGTNADFDAGVQTFTGQNTFAAGAKIAANQDFSSLPVQIFQGANTFGAGVEFTNSQDLSNGKHTFQGSTTFGTATKFAEGQDLSFASHIFGANSIFDEFIEFSNNQEFDAVMAFDKYQHFGDTSDFTEVVQTFKEGSTFGTGTSFKSDGTQSLPVGTIPAFGILLSTVTCTSSDCKPSDDSAYLQPGGLLSPGIDPVATFNSIESDDTSFSVDGLGLTMSFASVTGDGTIKTDLLDPNNVPSSTTTSDGIVTVSTTAGNSIPTVGSVIDLSAGTATISGNISITLPYEESNIPVGMNESNLTVIHYVNSEWIEETDCTIDTANNNITCTVTSLSPFGVGSKSGSAGASSTGSSGASGAGCSPDALNGKSLRMYEIKYNLCALSKIEILGYSTCGALNLTVKDENGINPGKVNPVQNYLNQTMLSMVADVSSNSNSYNIQVQNIRDDVRHLLIPEKLHGKLLSCTGNVVIEQFDGDHTGYTSNQENSQSRKISDDESSYIPRTENVSNKISNDESTIVKISENLLTEPEPPMYEPEPPMYEPEPPMYEPEPPENFFLLKWLGEIFSWMILDSK